MIFSDYEKLRAIIGNNILDCPGFGGNISIKGESEIMIKASGQDLKHRNHIVTLVSGCEIICSARSYTSENVSLTKPSMELSFHQAIDYKYVIHYHPVYVLPYLCMESMDSFYYPHEHILVGYKNPGIDLAGEIVKTPNAKVIFLKSHGVILASDSIEEINDNYNKIKAHFFRENNTSYTPDDHVDTNSDHLWLFRHAIENIANTSGITLHQLEPEDLEYLNSDPNENIERNK